MIFFWDGKSRKVVETDRWLKKPLYGNENIVFDEKLIGKWVGKDGDILMISKGAREETYRMVFREEGHEEYHYGANLVSVKGMMFLGIFFDASLLENKDSYGSHLLPDALSRVDQIGQKLLLRHTSYGYEEFAEMLKKDPNSLKQETEKSEDVFEFERVSVKL